MRTITELLIFLAIAIFLSESSLSSEEFLDLRFDNVYEIDQLDEDDLVYKVELYNGNSIKINDIFSKEEVSVETIFEEYSLAVPYSTHSFHPEEIEYFHIKKSQEGVDINDPGILKRKPHQQN